MLISYQRLPGSRLQYKAELSELEVSELFAEAIRRLGKEAKIPGFRPGKAPKYLLRDSLGLEKIREEAYSLGVAGAWREIVGKLTDRPVQDPEVEVEVFEENKPARLNFSFDIRPEVKLGDWREIKLATAEPVEVKDEEVEKVIDSLRQAHAQTIAKLEPSAKGDKMEVSFSGAVNKIKLNKLSANRFALVLGQAQTILGFGDQLFGLRKSEKKEFDLTFLKDHFDRELAGKSVHFEVVVNEVYQVNLPSVDREFVEKFGHDTPAKLRRAIQTDLKKQQQEELFTKQKAEWLGEFDKLLEVDLPESLIKVEIERSRQAWQEFLSSRHLNQKDWLSSRDLTLEQLEKDWRVGAQRSVRIGLGLAEVAKDLKKELKSSEDFQVLLDDLVKRAVK